MVFYYHNFIFLIVLCNLGQSAGIVEYADDIIGVG